MDPHRRIIKDGAVVIAGNQIVSVGPTSEVKGNRSGAQEIDARNGIVMPGLVNAHIHLSYSLAKGCGDDLPFVTWLPIVLRAEDAYEEPDWYLASMLSICEMIKSGTTCFADTNIYGEIDQVTSAIGETGIRATLGKNITDITSEGLAKNPQLKRPKDRLLSVSDAVEDYHRVNGTADGRIRIRFSPQVWPACSSQSYKEIAQVGREMGVGHLIHHTEAKEWGSFVQQEYGKPPTMMLHDFGILGPDTLLENATLLSDAEIDLIAETKTCLNYLPTPNMKNYLGQLDVPKLLARGVTMSLGTSGALINNVNDMFREMKTLALQQRVLKEMPDAIPAQTVLELATLGGAQCLGMRDEVGSLEVGKKADVILINAFQPHMLPMFDPVSQVVYCANGGDVETSIIDGRIVMLNRKLPMVDEDALLKRVAEDGARAMQRAGLVDESHAVLR